jgi:ATP-dependent DNA helicase RecQ
MARMPAFSTPMSRVRLPDAPASPPEDPFADSMFDAGDGGLPGDDGDKGAYEAGFEASYAADALEGKDPLDILREVFGYTSFRGEQLDIVNHVIGGSDALVLMPTGGGKSLCFQVPALSRRGVAIVVSPLKSLMQDQVSRLRQYGIAAAALNSSVSYAEQSRISADLVAGRIKLLYVAPERFTKPEFVALMGRMRLGTFAIDEAHCVSQWGHDFRKEYLDVGRVMSRFPGVPRIAVTATASPIVRKDVVDKLDLGRARTFLSSFDRPNITYQIAENGGSAQFQAFLAEHRGETGVVYALSQKKVAKTAEALRAQGYDAMPYHAGMDEADKAANLERFLKEEGVIMVGTIAFGMGIDKPNVRFVAHLDLPDSLEAYYQETGRAGRDGEPSVAWMAYGIDSVMNRRRMIVNGDGDEAHKAGKHQRLNALLGMVESADCRRGVVLRYFGEQHPGGCNNCDRCLNPVPTMDQGRATAVAGLLLNGIVQTGERFGLGVVAETVAGIRSKAVVERRFHALAAFGSGSTHSGSKEWWEAIGRQLYASDLIKTDLDTNYAVYSLTKRGRQALAGDVEFRLVEPSSAKGRQATVRRQTLAADVPPDRRDLAEALRAMRLRLARAQDLPAYIVFGDDTLVELVQAMPDTFDQLSRIRGMGASKVARYGSEILAVVARHKTPAPLPDRIAIPGFPRR